MARYSLDPRWGSSPNMPGPIETGARSRKAARVFYYPSTRTILTGEAAEQAARDFEAARQDEESGTW